MLKRLEVIELPEKREKRKLQRLEVIELPRRESDSKEVEEYEQETE